MKSFTQVALALVASASTATAHYVFPSVVVGGATTPPWTAMRQWIGYQTNDPVTNVTSLDIRCNVGGTTSTIGTNITTVQAGSTMGWTSDPAIYHPGPALAYLAKVPAGESASTWDGDGAVWFKIYAPPPTFTSSGMVWSNTNEAVVDFEIPAETPSGEYLLRVEQIGLHVASTVGGAQFYLSCGGLQITNGGSGSPSPLVSFPGAYSATDPGLLIDIYYPIPTNYTMPGPAIWPSS